MRADKWDHLLNLLVRQMGEVAGKRRFLEIWKEAGEKQIAEYEDEKELRETLKI